MSDAADLPPAKVAALHHFLAEHPRHLAEAAALRQAAESAGISKGDRAYLEARAAIHDRAAERLIEGMRSDVWLADSLLPEPVRVARERARARAEADEAVRRTDEAAKARKAVSGHGRAA